MVSHHVHWGVSARTPPVNSTMAQLATNATIDDFVKRVVRVISVSLLSMTVHATVIERDGHRSPHLPHPVRLPLDCLPGGRKAYCRPRNPHRSAQDLPESPAEFPAKTDRRSEGPRQSTDDHDGMRRVYGHRSGYSPHRRRMSAFPRP